MTDTCANVNDISGYSLYNSMIKKREKHNPLLSTGTHYPPLPNKKYSIIYADPPWDYGGKTQFDKSLVKKENPKYEKNIFLSSAVFKYPTLKFKDLKDIPVCNITDDDCILFMWATNPHLEQAIVLGKAWGFQYKTVAFVWDKKKHNPGQYTMSYCELCLLFKKGKIPKRAARNVKQLISIPRREHSVKPVEVRENIERIFPTHKKIELFARDKFANWDAWGIGV